MAMATPLSYPASRGGSSTSLAPTSLVFPAGTMGDLFTNYKPSTAAHVDFLSGGSGSIQAGSGVQVVRLSLRVLPIQPSSKDLLSILLPSIPLILADRPTASSFHAISAACHRLVLPPHNLGPTIYTRVHEELDKSVQGLAREWRGAIMGREAGLLVRLIAGWTEWERRVAMLSAVFVYLDRVYCTESAGMASIRDLAIATFRKGIWENELIFQKTRDEVLLWAQNEREAGMSNVQARPTIIAIISLAKLLEKYPTLWNPYRLAATEYYSAQSEMHIEQDGKSPTAYVQWVLDKVEEERERAALCLDTMSAEIVVGDVRKEVGSKMKDRVIRRAMDEAMDEADSTALARLYKFAVDTEAFRDFSQSLQAYIENRLQKLISDPANDPQMIDESLRLKQFLDKAIAALFEHSKPSIKAARTRAEAMDVDMPVAAPVPSLSICGEGASAEGIGKSAKGKTPSDTGTFGDPEVEDEGQGQNEAVKLAPAVRTMQLELQDAVRTGFKAGMGSRQNAPAEWIAKHLDHVMRRGQGSGTESAFNAQLDEIIALIGYTRDKDVFKAFYSTQLAKRLLLNKSASDDMERNMIIKLQKEMGEEFTTGDVMMKDLALSETLLKAYQTHLSKSTQVDPTNLSANVLTESAWPAYPLLKDGWAFKLTPELQGSVDDFTKWYATQHKNRQLSWRWQLATVTLVGRFGSAGGSGALGGGKYEIGVSLFQAVVLLAFNEDDELNFKELQVRTGIEKSELGRTLQSLSLGRKGTRVLLKTPPTKEVNDSDKFRYNKSFTSDRIKFKINQIQQDMSAEESKKTNEQVAVDRVSVLEATIVRVMKGRKKATMGALVDTVVGDVSKRFPPDVKEIKRRVENLIEREFLMRDEKDKNLLHYLA